MSIHKMKPEPPMPFGIKVFAWTIAILITAITAVALMIIIDQVCPIGTDRPEEIAHCWKGLL